MQNQHKSKDRSASHIQTWKTELRSITLDLPKSTSDNDLVASGEVFNIICKAEESLKKFPRNYFKKFKDHASTQDIFDANTAVDPLRTALGKVHRNILELRNPESATASRRLKYLSKAYQKYDFQSLFTKGWSDLDHLTSLFKEAQNICYKDASDLVEVEIKENNLVLDVKSNSLISPISMPSPNKSGSKLAFKDTSFFWNTAYWLETTLSRTPSKSSPLGCYLEK